MNIFGGVKQRVMAERLYQTKLKERLQADERFFAGVVNFARVWKDGMGGRHRESYKPIGTRAFSASESQRRSAENSMPRELHMMMGRLLANYEDLSAHNQTVADKISMHFYPNPASLLRDLKLQNRTYGNRKQREMAKKEISARDTVRRPAAKKPAKAAEPKPAQPPRRRIEPKRVEPKPAAADRPRVRSPSSESDRVCLGPQLKAKQVSFKGRKAQYSRSAKKGTKTGMCAYGQDRAVEWGEMRKCPPHTKRLYKK